MMLNPYPIEKQFTLGRVPTSNTNKTPKLVKISRIAKLSVSNGSNYADILVK